MIKPIKLNKGDTVAVCSPSWGCAGGRRVKWKYEKGVENLKSLGLNVIPTPNALKGTTYLRNNPKARAEDLNWAFANKEVKAIICNVGGNDSLKILPFLDDEIIKNNPKIFCGYSDILSVHMYLHKLGLITYYGDNLLTTIADSEGWEEYSKYWFVKTFFSAEPIGEIKPSKVWSFSKVSYVNRNYKKDYIKNTGCEKIQGTGVVQGELFGGHGMLMEYNCPELFTIDKELFKDKILFFEDIPEMCTPKYMENFFKWLGSEGILNVLKGIVIGKMRSPKPFDNYAKKIIQVVSFEYGLKELPIMYGLNFGHASPIFILPYNVMAELDIDNMKFSILESGVSNNDF